MSQAKIGRGHALSEVLSSLGDEFADLLSAERASGQITQFDSVLATHLCDLEVSLLRPDVRQSDRVVELLADEFIEFGSSGRTYDKAQIVSSMRNAAPVNVTAIQTRVSMLGTHVAQVTYIALRHSDPPVRTLRSSLWRLEGDQWKMVFHQGTVVASQE